MFGCSVQDLGFRVQGLGFRFGPRGSWSTGLGCRVFLQPGAKDREWCFRALEPPKPQIRFRV